MSGTVQISDALQFIQTSRGKIFSIRFIKRSTGLIRPMRCRTGVRAHLTGGGAPYNFAAQGLLSVFEMIGRGSGYKAVPVEGIQEIKIRGTWFKVVHLGVQA